MPARAFIKCSKSHTGFFSCERCIVKGETVNRTRVFKELNCTERTLQSFKDKANPDHHLTKENSPLLDINNFDVIKFVILDEMHMLYLGISICFKSLYSKSHHRLFLKKMFQNYNIIC